MLGIANIGIHVDIAQIPKSSELMFVMPAMPVLSFADLTLENPSQRSTASTRATMDY
jgi:hypothetical protein